MKSPKKIHCTALGYDTSVNPPLPRSGRRRVYASDTCALTHTCTYTRTHTRILDAHWAPAVVFLTRYARYLIVCACGTIETVAADGPPPVGFYPVTDRRRPYRRCCRCHAGGGDRGDSTATIHATVNHDVTMIMLIPVCTISFHYYYFTCNSVRMQIYNNIIHGRPPASVTSPPPPPPPHEIAIKRNIIFTSAHMEIHCILRHGLPVGTTTIIIIIL